MLEKLFHLKKHHTTPQKELMAGLVTFLAMSYILIVNPKILGLTGMDTAALFTATALICAISTLLMALIANLPIVLAPAMSANTFFATTVVLAMGYPWQFAITAVLIMGIIFILLTAFNVWDYIAKSIPKSLKLAMPAGIGLFIAFIGLQNAGIVVQNERTMVALGSFADKGIWVALAGLLITGALLARKFPGAILVGILAASVISWALGLITLPHTSLVNLPPNIAPIFAQFQWSQIFTMDMLIVVFTFLFLSSFDSIGTVIAVASKAGLTDKQGNFSQIKKALWANSLGTTIGSVLGMSPVVSFIESSTGVAAGGRTGLMAVGVALLFVLALFFAPLFLLIPVQAVAPALIIVGLHMISSILEVDFTDFTEALPAYLCMIIMPFTFSIAMGIIIGVLSYVAIKLLAGKFKDISPTLYVLAVLFLVKIITDVLS
ncbi:MAG: NCS2 family permease [Prevotellaceae bacterium]|jgi:AGZA family xanthine/uracil permease-like MFS transporter|nr:NCS2 family permease [Prevotellaceae bacterium]